MPVSRRKTGSLSGTARRKAIWRSTLSAKDKGAALSYLQLIEVAVVAAFRKTGVSLPKIRAAREYVSKQLEAEFPFAEYRFKTDGRDLWMDYAQIEADMGDKKLLKASQQGQLASSRASSGSSRNLITTAT